MKKPLDLISRDEIEVSRTYVSGDGLKLTIDAGTAGWIIRNADDSENAVVQSARCYQSADNNLNDALNNAKKHFPELKEV